MKIAQKLLISDTATFDQLTTMEQKLWTEFETADIYRFLTGEEDMVPEFQYNWTSIPRLQPLGPHGNRSNNSNTDSSSYTSCGATGASSGSSLTSRCHFQGLIFLEFTTLLADSVYIRYEA
jgi:hypothetical protein